MDIKEEQNNDKLSPVRPSRRGGRSTRLNSATVIQSISTHGPLEARKIPAYELLNEDALIALEVQADWILKEVGIEFRGDKIALDLFRSAGADVQGERVRFDTGHARKLCSTAPSSYKLHGRDPKHTVTLGGKNIVLMPGYGSPFVTDLNNGRRYASLKDFHNFVKMTYSTPWLHHSGGTVCEPVDIPVNKRHLDMIYAHLRLSTKPFMGGVTSPSRAQDSIDMAKLVFGHSFMQQNAVIQANINVNSPLIYDETMSAALRIYAAENQCVAVSPAIFGGAMGPVSQPAVIAQTLAEGMAGIALTQLVRKGCPTILGSFHSTMNLKSGALTFGTPEANMATMALSQLVKRLGIPVRSGGGQVTSSNAADGQAMQDSTSSMWATMISGANQVWHSAGWLEGGLTMSYEKFVLDLDNCGMLMQMMKGIQVNEETLTKESYYESGPGENFLSTAHTLRNFATANYQSSLPDTGPYEKWSENGSLTAAQRANGIWKAMLANYEMPHMDENIDEALKDFIACRKETMSDEWY